MPESIKIRDVVTKKKIFIALKKISLTFLILSPIFVFLGIMCLYQLSFPDRKEPFVQWSGRDPRTEVIITWETESKQKSIVFYGTSKNNLNMKISIDEEVKIHRVVLSGLKPSTKYYYKVGKYSDKDDDWSNINSFETAPNNTNTEFKFAIYSDSQQFFGIGWHNRICQAITSEKDLKFVAIAGDLCQNWDYKPDWNQFFYEAAVYTKDTPMVPCIGNHDGYYPEDDPKNEKHYYIKYFGFPYGENNKTLYYSFNWSNTQFIISEISKTGDEDPNNPRNIKHDRWLNKTLAKGQDKAFRILIFHRQVFSAEENNDILINRITPIVEKYNISLVLYGHHHHYERFQYNEHTYICLGGGGGQQFGSNFFRPTKYTEKFVMGPTYTIISIKNDKMEITTKTAEKDIVDYYEIKANLS